VALSALIIAVLALTIAALTGASTFFGGFGDDGDWYQPLSGAELRKSADAFIARQRERDDDFERHAQEVKRQWEQHGL
jgi:hypothetical protein